MKSQRFNPEKDLTPMPFDERICRRALEMKQNGLVWRPHVGCFVWDPDENIKPDSPFPGRIYFILSLQRFIDIFETIDQIADKLVWLPTWHQAQLIYQQLVGSETVINNGFSNGRSVSATEALLHIYGLIIDALREKAQLDTA
jgi:hypothetical protein